MNFIKNTGWVCPQCNSSLAPWIPYCCKVKTNHFGEGENQYFLDKNIDQWLTVRTSRHLKQENIHTFKQLIEKTESDLLKTPNLGKKSLNEIKEFLCANNLCLKN